MLHFNSGKMDSRMCGHVGLLAKSSSLYDANVCALTSGKEKPDEAKASNI